MSGPALRLVLAVSGDGFLARGSQDDMRWTAKGDKTAFKLLTHVGGVCAAGSTTFDCMPSLPGRTLVRLSRRPTGDEMTLGDFASAQPTGWLLGGPTVANVALTRGLVSEVFLCRSLEVSLGDGIRDDVTPRLMRDGWKRSPVATVHDTRVELWRR